MTEFISTGYSSESYHLNCVFIHWKDFQLSTLLVPGSHYLKIQQITWCIFSKIQNTKVTSHYNVTIGGCVTLEDWNVRMTASIKNPNRFTHEPDNDVQHFRCMLYLSRKITCSDWSKQEFLEHVTYHQKININVNCYFVSWKSLSFPPEWL